MHRTRSLTSSRDASRGVVLIAVMLASVACASMGHKEKQESTYIAQGDVAKNRADESCYFPSSILFRRSSNHRCACDPC